MHTDSFPVLYGITDRALMPGPHLLTRAEQALAAGLKMLQYRDKQVQETDRRRREASDLANLCRQYGALLIVNDDVELALHCEADGVHLGQQDTSIAEARKRLGAQAIIGATCHGSVQLAALAVEHSANYLAFGRFFSSHTKADAEHADLAVLAEARRQFAVPIVAIGGITHTTVEHIWQAGAHCAAVCHALFANDPARAVKTFLNQHMRTA
jgi:thiamine-phosphate pyrophosphorylase